MPQPLGRRLALSLPRRFIADLVHFARQIPLASIHRRMNLGTVNAVRRQAQPRPGWCALFTKAYAFVAARRPALRRVYVPLPWPHLYEHPLNIAAVSVERRFGDEEAVFFAHLRSPEEQSLLDIDRHLDTCKEGPLERIGLFRRLLTISRFPGPVRHLLWWFGLNMSGRRRARYLGTFGVSVVSNFGATSPYLLTPVTTALNYGVVADDGTVDVYLTYDHRVLDGGGAARALEELEGVLTSEIVTELRYLEKVDDAAPSRACA